MNEKTERQKMKNIIETNNILIEIYKNVPCVASEVRQMQLENIQLLLILNKNEKII